MWAKRVSQFSESDWANHTDFQGMIVPRTGSGKSNFEITAENLGLGRIEQWLTMEDWTGFLVGWQGCMAEDSISFLKAFDAVKIGERDENGKVLIHNELSVITSSVVISRLTLNSRTITSDGALVYECSRKSSFADLPRKTW